MADWNQCRLLADGWTVRRDSSGYTLSAEVYAKTRDALPIRGAYVPVSGPCAVPGQFASYVVTESEIRQLTPVGPFIASLTVRSWLGVASGAFSDSLMHQRTVSTGYMDYHIKPSWLFLRKRQSDAAHPQIIGGYVSTVKGESSAQWSSNHHSPSDACPFSTRPHKRFCDRTIRFLQITATYYVQQRPSELRSWGKFAGIIPVRSMPSWLTPPGGDNRWRLYEEHLESERDTNGLTRLYRVTRILIGIPSNFVNYNNRRCQWDKSKVGQRDWNDI